MTNLNNEVRELSLDEVDGVSGGSLLSALKALYNGIRDESATGFVANAVRQTGNTPGSLPPW